MRRHVTAMLGATLLAVMMAGVARADGEAGLVIDYGNGNVQTFCVGFAGDSIGGDALLARAGKAVTEFSGLICSIDGTGCADNGSFGGCLCECQEPGGDCTYWSFFTQAAGGGGWRYSSGGFRAQAVRNGEMHAWKWGQGSPNSAPAPPAISFTSVCGAPEPTATAVVAVPTAVPPTSAPPTAAPANTVVPTATTETGGFTPAPPDGVTVVSPSAVASVGAAASPTSVVVGAGTTVPTTVVEPVDSGSDGGNSTGVVAFGAVVTVLLAAIGGAAVWRRRGGA